jgi:hypothetical protein
LEKIKADFKDATEKILQYADGKPIKQRKDLQVTFGPDERNMASVAEIKQIIVRKNNLKSQSILGPGRVSEQRLGGSTIALSMYSDRSNTVRSIWAPNLQNKISTF